MRILVTGGAGYVGSVCVELLIEAGHEVTVYDDLSEGHRSSVNEQARFVLARPAVDGDAQRAIADARAEAVMHFGAHALVAESMVDPGKYFRNNVVNGLRLLDATIACGVKKFVFSSTCAVYGAAEGETLREDSRKQPANPYGDSKLMFEKMLEWYRQIHGLEFVAFRYFNAAGATARCGEHHRQETHLIPNVLKVALGQKPHVELYGTDFPTPDGTAIRDYIHIADIAAAHMAALAPGKHGFFNLGNGRGYSVREVIRCCEQLTGRPIPVVERPRRPGDPPKLVATADKAMRELGWQPRQPTLEQIVGSAWDWHKRHPNGYLD